MDSIKTVRPGLKFSQNIFKAFFTHTRTAEFDSLFIEREKWARENLGLRFRDENRWFLFEIVNEQQYALALLKYS